MPLEPGTITDLTGAVSDGRLEFDPADALKSANAARDLYNDLIGKADAVVTAGLNDLSAFGTLNSGRELAEVFNDKANRLQMAINEHAKLARQLSDLFVAAGKAFDDAEDESSESFKGLNNFEFKENPGKYSPSADGDKIDVNEPMDHWVHAGHNSKDPDKHDVPSFINDYQNIDDGSVVTVENKDSVTFQELYDLGQAIEPQPVMDSATTWYHFGKDLDTTLSTFVDQIVVLNRSWVGPAAQKAADAITAYQDNMDPLFTTISQISKLLEFTAEWLNHTKKWMPPNTDRHVGCNDRLDDYRDAFEKTYITGMKATAENMPLLDGPLTKDEGHGKGGGEGSGGGSGDGSGGGSGDGSDSGSTYDQGYEDGYDDGVADAKEQLEDSGNGGGAGSGSGSGGGYGGGSFGGTAGGGGPTGSGQGSGGSRSGSGGSRSGGGGSQKGSGGSGQGSGGGPSPIPVPPLTDGTGGGGGSPSKSSVPGGGGSSKPSQQGGGSGGGSGQQMPEIPEIPSVEDFLGNEGSSEFGNKNIPDLQPGESSYGSGPGSGYGGGNGSPKMPKSPTAADVLSKLTGIPADQLPDALKDRKITASDGSGKPSLADALSEITGIPLDAIPEELKDIPLSSLYDENSPFGSADTLFGENEDGERVGDRGSGDGAGAGTSSRSSGAGGSSQDPLGILANLLTQGIQTFTQLGSGLPGMDELARMLDPSQLQQHVQDMLNPAQEKLGELANALGGAGAGGAGIPDEPTAPYPHQSSASFPRAALAPAGEQVAGYGYGPGGSPHQPGAPMGGAPMGGAPGAGAGNGGQGNEHKPAKFLQGRENLDDVFDVPDRVKPVIEP
ncbi:hypothetical protein [Nocardia flavorosea]|uniref:Uncharacterized protein n=1 Tax=Nocardia flavorosea TaxID=53429 RepID=A0A846YMF9_9NOCA|nr:hypothetical protein [Nocardia flavorosea]NKY60866.1 hypothetical protein [Nocardia flavorosea]